MTKYGRDGGVGIRIAEVVAFYKLEGVLADSGGGGPFGLGGTGKGWEGGCRYGHVYGYNYGQK